jgi:hypothetical protein
MNNSDELPYGRQDELPHVEEDKNFNDSVYFNFYDPVARLGGVIRIGNRVNLGYAEVTVHLPLPDGTLFFSYANAPLDSIETHNSGGLHVEVLDPLKTLRITFDGDGSIVPRAADLATNTGTALREHAGIPSHLDLTWTGRYPIHAITESGDMLEGHDQPFARDHYEQFGFLSGSIGIGSEIYKIDSAPGSRDHSWGPRDWLAPQYWNATLVYMDDGVCVSASEVKTHDGNLIMGGTIFTPDGTVRPIVDCRIENVYLGEAEMHTPYTVRATARDGFEFEASATNIEMVPLRHRPQSGGINVGIQRIGQALSKFEREGVNGWGWTDFWRYLPKEFDSADTAGERQ